MVEGCPQAWHGGLPSGLLVECRFHAGHRGQHRNEDSTMSWGGTLTEAEADLARRLRERAVAGG